MNRTPHIVDVLIAERAPRITVSLAWPYVRPMLHAVLGYSKARAMADAIASMSGQETLEHVSRLLALKVETDGLSRLPRSGPLVCVCNHPTGIADGLAVYDAVKAVRPDLIFFANADALRVAPRLSETVIPVEWVEEKRTREKTRLTLIAARQALDEARCLMMFPAGRLARREGGVLTDPPWMASAVSLARKAGAPIVPMHLDGPNATLFHLFDRISKELRDITLFHEMLNKEGGRYSLIVGEPIDAHAVPGDAQAATAALKAYVERTLPVDPRAPWRDGAAGPTF